MDKKPSRATVPLSWVLTSIFHLSVAVYCSHIGQLLFLSLFLKDIAHGLGNFELAQESMVKIFRQDKNYLKLRSNLTLSLRAPKNRPLRVPLRIREET
jgi:hypothetical protein